MPASARPANHNSSSPRPTPRLFSLALALAALAALPSRASSAETPVQPENSASTVQADPSLSASIAYASPWWIRFRACIYILHRILGGTGGEDLSPPELIERAHALFVSHGWPQLSDTEAAAAISNLNLAQSLIQQSSPDDIDPAVAQLWGSWLGEMGRSLPDLTPSRP